MSEFRHPALKQLTDQQVRFAPEARQREQLARAARLLGEIDVERVYPYQFICFRVTEFRTDAFPDLRISGRDLRHDLRLMIARLDRSLPTLPIEASPEPMVTLEDVSRRLKISTKTFRRWQAANDLAGWRVLVDGRRHLGFPEAAVERFIAERPAQVERGRRFSHMSDNEKHEILTSARQLAGAGESLTAVSRRIASKMGRSTEAVRSTIRTFDRAHPELAVYPNAAGPLDRSSKHLIYNAYRKGISVNALAKRFRRTRTPMYRVISEVRAEQLSKQVPDYIANPTFDDATEFEAILAPMPNLEEFEAARAKLRAPKDVPAELAPLYEVPLLTKPQEQHLFRKMNFLKHRLHKLCDRFRREDGSIDPDRVDIADLEEIERRLDEVADVKDLLISCNMRLVVSIAKRHSGQTDNFFELLSDGNISLMRAVEKFDYARGNKFSTYASWAIMKNFARSIPEEVRQRERYVTGRDELFEAAPDNRTDEQELLHTAEQATHRVNRLLDHLAPRDREIVRLRAGLDGSEPKTLEQIGQQLGITKERVRQLNVRIMKQLRDIAGGNPTNVG